MIEPTISTPKYDLYLGDCLPIMREMEAGSVDAILTDIPYGTTQCAWDEIIPFAPMWEGVKRVLKPRGVFVTTASQPFTSKLVMSNLEWFKYEWIWSKNIGSRFLDAKLRPLLFHENILVFSEKGHTYNPQKIKVKPRFVTRSGHAEQYQNYSAVNTHNGGENYPRTILDFARENDTVHPTQKPVELYAYLAATYTNMGDTVLDICFGSCTTGVACMQLGRKFIGIEIDPTYFDIAAKRIERAAMQEPLFTT